MSSFFLRTYFSQSKSFGPSFLSSIIILIQLYLLSVSLLFFIAVLEYILNISISPSHREIIWSFLSFFLSFFFFSIRCIKVFVSLSYLFTLFVTSFLPWHPFIPTPHWDSILTKKIDSRERQEFCSRQNRWQRIVASPQDCRRQQYRII